MAGYTPVFDSVFKGSLYGKWPDTAAWICLLALADWQGHIDIMPEAVAGMTGMPLPDLLGCIERFCAPDPRSRSQAEDGRKLVPLDPARTWGWRVVNIQVYREKARNQNQISDGRNAEKVRKYKERHRKTPADTLGHSGTRHSDSYSNTDSNKEEEPDRSARASRSARATRLPEEFTLTPERRAIAETEKADPDREFLNFTDHWKAASGSKARKNDWDATWRIWCRRAPDFKPNGRGHLPGKKTFDERMAALREDES